ncbi:MAG: FecR family protein [Caulobacter sp.]
MVDDRKAVRMDPDAHGRKAPTLDARSRDAAAREQAAEWYARLNSPRISNAELAAFYAWRADSLNDAAYTRVEAAGAGLRAVGDHPALQALAEQALARKKGRKTSLSGLLSRPLPPLAGLGALAAAGLIAAVSLGAFGQTYATGVGERRAITLADGSTIELNTDSKVRVRLSKDRRDLSLDKGQALFIVAHDARRPFVVTAGDTAVRAVGTRFEVYRRAKAVQVTLAEGRVEVRKAGTTAPPLTLAAGERVEVGGKTSKPTRIDVAAATGWTDGRLTFKDARLADAVAEINRYSKTRIVLGPGVSPDQRFNGVFDAGDSEAFAQGVALALDLKSGARADGAIELTAANATRS